MSKRYVFWREPTGKVYRGNDNKHAPSELLAEIGTSASVNSTGQVQWQGLACLRFETGIRASIVVLDHDEELNANDTWSIVQPAMLSIIKKNGGKTPVLPSELLREADTAAAKHFRSPLLNYTLISSLSLKSCPVSHLKVQKCEIAPLLTRKRYPLPKSISTLTCQSQIGKHLQATEYQLVRVKAVARTVNEASERALSALNLLRGYWNLFATYGSWSMNFGMGELKKAGLGAVHIGPVHTLYRPDRTVVEEIYWYEPDYVEDRELFEPTSGWEKLEKHRRWAMRCVRNLKYRGDLEDLLIRYTFALDQPNLDLAFLHMWGILEKITDTVGARYDDTIQRAIWPFKDRRLAKDELAALRQLRNQFVHAAKSDGNRQQIAYVMKSFVEPHLLRLIRNDFCISNIAEYGNYLSLPTDVDTLNEQRKQLTRAIRMRTQWAKSTKGS